ncbi:MAG: Alpha-L-fucosidase [candidate division TA06 bacterium ADurb.Bin417]|uniref:Alpha-L-fucosidase n=1 Tax=candidate division TA06 bacterium ADurb.Bin417 TaxID=1852828 RepID=A0A1V5MKI0_UNCT6|nr:MAG: Alpha-L-fucosidase [candidate division TA06 bacterium ADurb.Bin417]
MKKESGGNWHARSFFGLHYDLHANAQDTVLGRDTDFEHIYRELKKVKPDFVQYDGKGHPGYAGYPTRVGTPSPGIVKDALKVWREVTRKLDIPLSVHYSGVWDKAALARHPEWGRIKADGSWNDIMTCCNSDYTEKLMIPQLLEIIDRYDVDGFWVDGENWAMAPCWCPRCLELFRKETGVARPPRSKEEPHWREWLAFHRRAFENHVCSNWLYSVRQPEEVSLPVDYLSGDFTPSFGCERAAIEARFLASRGLTWDLMAWGFYGPAEKYPWEFKTAEHLQQEAAEVIANGGGLFVYDVPIRSGRLTGWHQDILAEVARFCRDRQPYCQGTESLPQAALLHNSLDYYNNNDPLYKLARATEHVEGALQSLLENHCHVDILNEKALAERIEEYPLVVLPEVEELPEEFLAACGRYVRKGGHLLVSGERSAARLGKVLGVEPEGEASERTAGLPVERQVVMATGRWQPVKTAGGRVLAYEQELDGRRVEPARPLATIHRLGRGKAVGIYGPVFRNFFNTRSPRLRAFLGRVLAEMDNPHLIRVSAPPRIEVILRRDEKRILVHLLNRSAGHPLSNRNHAVEEVPPAGPVGLSLPLAERPKRVRLAPGRGRCGARWRNGRLEVTVAAVGVHQVVVVELGRKKKGRT